jgi:hypothetical protein
MNPLKPEIVAATIFCDFTSSLTAHIEPGMKLTGKLDKLSLTVTKVKPLFDSQETVGSMSGKIEALQQMLFLSINNVLSEGAKLPLPSYAENDLTDSKLTPFDHYLLFEADPDVHKYITSDSLS